MPLVYWETIPIRPFIAVWPMRAMASATLNAVPDKDGYRLPRMLSITGYVADSPIPTSPMPTGMICGGYVEVLFEKVGM